MGLPFKTVFTGHDPFILYKDDCDTINSEVTLELKSATY